MTKMVCRGGASRTVVITNVYLQDEGMKMLSRAVRLVDFFEVRNATLNEWFVHLNGQHA
jgi:hypothetical protein